MPIWNAQVHFHNGSERMKAVDVVCQDYSIIH
jgi:hypothetical protein